jgi:AcrR family transcriptional regulator
MRTGREPRVARGESGMRADILHAATERFGRDGYENTRWADVAADVGLGPTALYHYFESKQHCLFVILDSALRGYTRRFAEITSAHVRFDEALRAVLADTFALDGHAVLRNQLLVAESGLLGTPRRSPREEHARRCARESISGLERDWSAFLVRGMQARSIEDCDPRMLARAILGLHNSVWHWYRLGGLLGLPDVSSFFVERGLAMAGCLPVAPPVPPTPSS